MPFLLVGAVVAVAVVVMALLFTHKEPYACPAGQSVAATVRQHGLAGRMLVTLVVVPADRLTEARQLLSEITDYH